MWNTSDHPSTAAGTQRGQPQPVQRVRGERRDRPAPARSTPRRRSGCSGSRRGSRTLRENRSSLKFAQYRGEEHVAAQQRDLGLERREPDPDHRKDARRARRARAPRACPTLAAREPTIAQVSSRCRRRPASASDDEERQQEQHDHRDRRAVADAVLGEEPPVDREAHHLGRGARPAAGEEIDLVEHLERRRSAGTRASRRSSAASSAGSRSAAPARRSRRRSSPPRTRPAAATRARRAAAGTRTASSARCRRRRPTRTRARFSPSQSCPGRPTRPRSWLITPKSGL